MWLRARPLATNDSQAGLGLDWVVVITSTWSPFFSGVRKGASP